MKYLALNCTLVLLLCFAGLADEGLWLFNDFPSERVKEKYGFQPSQSFLDHIRLSSTRLNNGGSGSFVSPKGLVFTNHHVASDCIQKLTTKENNYMRDGFHGATLADEEACPDLEINVLVKIEDVTGEVKNAAPPDADPAEANRLKKSAMNRIEKRCNEATGSRCDVETFYSGGQYHLYQYKRYTDIRLVFAPEASIAAFGGDPDNFTYPRYCLDFAFFRVYEHGRPAATPRHLPWSRKGAADGELTFVPGHPGSTGRLLTVSALEFSRDVSYPLVHQRSKRLGDALLEFSGASEDNTRIARDNLLGMQNSLKAYTGFLAGLHNDKLMARKRAEEKELRDAVMADAKLRAEFGSTWDDVSAAYAEYAKIYKRYRLLESYPERGSELLRVAILVLRHAEETTKPNEERLRDFAEAALPSVRRRMYSPAPIEDSMEIVILTDYLRYLISELGADDPTVKALLDGASPAAAARKYVESSKLKDVDERKRLAEDLDAVRASTDGMIHMARILDQPGRKLRKIYEDKVEAPVRASGGRIAAARYAVKGAGDNPMPPSRYGFPTVR